MARQPVLAHPGKGSFKAFLMVAALIFIVVRWPSESASFIRAGAGKAIEFMTVLSGGAA
ncbi:hypothetical protein [Saccharopolyspora hirsuta]|uniref:hypothetical protein n=1 Tax=Saccharopolyspora hirsuta TaxID=1837 RepID=UPI0014792764|nr:hypothetical protein [Saccharopolyspora hirsuta]